MPHTRFQITLLVLAAILASSPLAFITSPAHAQAPAAVPISLPAQSLGSALNELARQARLQLMVHPDLVANKQAPAVSGTLTPQQALDRVLAGSGLTADIQGAEVIIRRVSDTAESSVTTLAEMKVTAQGVDDSTTEGTNSYTTRSMSTATGLTLSPRETPQSVSVLTRQQIDDRAMITLDDALRNVTGIVVRKGDYVGDSGGFNARGFEISNMMLDGVPINTGANGTFNPDNDSLDIYDRVEVVRGATGLMTGAGTPSASVNLVRKRPTADRQTQITALVGSWRNLRAAVDAGGALNEAGTLRARAVVTAQDSKQFYDIVHDRNHQVYGIVEADVTPTTLLAAGFHYRRVDNDGTLPSLPVREDGSFYPGLSRSTNLGNAFDYWKQTDKTAFAEITQQLGGDWSARLVAIWKRPEQDLLFSGTSHRDGDTLYQTSQRYVLDSQQDSYDLSLKGSFMLFQRRHELAFGASARKYNLMANGGWDATAWTNDAPVVDPYHWDANAVPRPFIDMTLWTQHLITKQKSFYAVSRWHLAKPLRLILGTRVHYYDFENRRDDISFKVTNEITPYAGLLYDIDARHTAYASWTEIFEPQSSIDRNGNYLKPITGVNYEAGAKGEYFDGRLNASVAVFLIQQQNRAVADLTGPNPCPGTGFGYCSRASGGIESKGVELEVSGALTANWQIVAGFTHAVAKYTKETDTSLIGTLYRPELPRNQFKLSTMYKLPGALQRWRIGGNVYVQSRVNGSWDNLQSEQKAYAIFGLQVGYRPTEQLDLRLVINNLFDKHYYANIGWNTGGSVFGAPRNAILTAQYRF